MARIQNEEGKISGDLRNTIPPLGVHFTKPLFCVCLLQQKLMLLIRGEGHDKMRSKDNAVQMTQLFRPEI